MQYYLRITNNDFGFVVTGIHDISDIDKPIMTEDYERFFELQSKGKQFRLKTIPTGTKLFDLVEEYTVEPILIKEDTSQEEFLIDLDFRVSKMELGV